MPRNPAFSHSEYRARVDKVRLAMDAAGVEVLFATDPSNMAWLTGYDGWSFYTPQAVLIGPGRDPIIWTRAMDAPGGRLTTWMGADHILSYPDNYVMHPDRHPVDLVPGLLSDLNWAGRPIGVEMENYYYSARMHARLAAGLSVAPMDATNLVNWCRAVKSEAELVFMSRAARIVEAMHARILDTFAPGMRKCDVVAEIYDAALRGTPEFGGDYAAIVPMVPTGDEAAAAHLTWDDRPVPSGTGTFFEIAGCYRRYHVPLCRTTWLGKPPRDVAAAEAAVLEGIAEGIGAARPGATAGDVARAFYGALARHGVEREGRCGYPVGLSYPPDWGERTFSIRPEDETVLETDMVFHFMPAIWMADWGLEITETLRVVEGGPAEPLAQVPRKLFVKD